VTTAAAAIEDVPVYLNGLGTVQPLNAVEIKAQVKGTLIALPVREGAEVHQGDVAPRLIHARTKRPWIRKWRSATRKRHR
jgi:membrane fusion protein, multidrug efflux system